MNHKKLLIALAVLFSASVSYQAGEAQQAPKYRVSQGVMDANLIHKVNPVYPQEAKDAHIQGDVILQATIDREGKVSELKALSGHPLLVDASMNAVREWKYKPLLLHGDPVDVETTIRVQFRLGRS